MKIVDSPLSEVKIIIPDCYSDNRGWFMESFNQKKLKENGVLINILQQNSAFSNKKGTIRGLHYQENPRSQAKLVRCIKGSIFDIAVDIRSDSPNFGNWFGIELSMENQKQLYIPKGFAHAAVTLENDTEFQYFVDEEYSPKHERSIRWDDPTIGIELPKNIIPILSEKDENAPFLSEINLIKKED